jgi:hypothetical protein
VNTPSQNFNAYDSGSRISLRDVIRGRREEPVADPRVIARSAEPYVTLEDIDVRHVNVDAYQRELNPSRVRAMIRKWKPLIFGVPELSRRSDGSYFVIDGQHRISAIVQMPDAVPQVIRALVWHGLSPKQEAEKFAEAQDSKHRRPILPEDTHNAQVYAEDDRALRINAVVEAAGYRIGKAGGNSDLPRIGAVQKVYEVAERYGVDILSASLRFITETWGASSPPEGPLVGGVAQFMAMYPDARYTPMMRRLSTNYSMKQFIARASESGRDAGYRSKVDQITWKLYREHNVGTRGKRMIHGFEDTFSEHRGWVRSQAAKRRFEVQK